MKKLVNIKDFGACANESLQTRAIQDAIDTVFLAGGGAEQEVGHYPTLILCKITSFNIGLLQ